MRKQKPIRYRWVQDETVVENEDGTETLVPAHQEEGDYVRESSIPGWIVVKLHGEDHLIRERDVAVVKE